MLWFVMSLAFSFSLSAYSENQPRIYRGVGVEFDQDESKIRYDVKIKINKESGDRYKFLTIHTGRAFEDGSYTGRALKLVITGTDSFTIVDKDGDRLGWGYEIEFENENSPKVHALVLNYRLSDRPDSNIVSHLLRFVKAENSVTSTGSIVDTDGNMVSAWSSKSYR